MTHIPPPYLDYPSDPSNRMDLFKPLQNLEEISNLATPCLKGWDSRSVGALFTLRILAGGYTLCPPTLCPHSLCIVVCFMMISVASCRMVFDGGGCYNLTTSSGCTQVDNGLLHSDIWDFDTGLWGSYNPFPDGINEKRYSSYPTLYNDSDHEEIMNDNPREPRNLDPSWEETTRTPLYLQVSFLGMQFPYSNLMAHSKDCTLSTRTIREDGFRQLGTIIGMDDSRSMYQNTPSHRPNFTMVNVTYSLFNDANDVQISLEDLETIREMDGIMTDDQSNMTKVINDLTLKKWLHPHDYSILNSFIAYFDNDDTHSLSKEEDLEGFVLLMSSTLFPPSLPQTLAKKKKSVHFTNNHPQLQIDLSNSNMTADQLGDPPTHGATREEVDAYYARGLAIMDNYLSDSQKPDSTQDDLSHEMEDVSFEESTASSSTLNADLLDGGPSDLVLDAPTGNSSKATTPSLFPPASKIHLVDFPIRNLVW